jgi:hypothetical protein
VVVATWLVGSASGVAAGEPAAPESLFFHDQDYGSESQFNPATVLVSCGFVITGNHSYETRLSHIDFRNGASNLFDNLADPFGVIERGGLGAFVAHEVFPYRGLESKYGQSVPNYLLHVAGEGMLMRKLEDWYALRALPAPRLWALGTLLSAQLLNEAVENGSYRGGNWDPIADVYLFNTLGYLLFSIDGVARFFAGPVQLSFWPGQAVIDVTDTRLLNVNESFAFHISLGSWTRWRGFFYTGISGLFGVSIPVDARDTFSVGFGPQMLAADSLYSNGVRITVPRVPMDVAVGLFWDRERSLMASAQVGGPERKYVTLNLYPGWLRVDGVGVGGYVLLNDRDGLAAGVTVQYVPIVPGLAATGVTTGAR